MSHNVTINPHDRTPVPAIVLNCSEIQSDNFATACAVAVAQQFGAVVSVRMRECDRNYIVPYNRRTLDEINEFVAAFRRWGYQLGELLNAGTPVEIASEFLSLPAHERP